MGGVDPSSDHVTLYRVQSPDKAQIFVLADGGIKVGQKGNLHISGPDDPSHVVYFLGKKLASSDRPREIIQFELPKDIFKNIHLRT